MSTHAANHHEVTLVQLSFDFYMIEAKPENLIGDRAYDSDKLDDDTARTGHRDDRAASLESRKQARPRTVDGCAATSDAGSSNASSRGFSGNVGSWFAGSTTRANFLGFVQLAALCILLKQF